MLFIYLGDGVMSYFAPVVMEETLGGTTKMGLIMAISSVAGLITDVLFAQFFPSKKTLFFQRTLLGLAFFFPLSFFISLNPIVFVMAMVWWGISYEAMMFTTYHAIHESVSRAHHAWAWGIVSIIHNIALAAGPLIATVSYDRHQLLPAAIAILFQGTAVALYFSYLFIFKFKNTLDVPVGMEVEAEHARTLPQQLKIWQLLDRKLWPLLGFFTLYYLLDSAIYAVGPIYAEKLKLIHPWGGAFVSLYAVPGIFVAVLVPWLSRPFGKKRLAYGMGLIAGVCLLAMSMMSGVLGILGSLLLAASALAIFHPAMTAVFEDYVARAEIVANDLISLTSITSSIAYVIGPIINGYLAERLGEQMIYGLWGGSLLIASLLLLAFFPRKVRLPQHELQEIIDET